jgi:hypothetical protein
VCQHCLQLKRLRGDNEHSAEAIIIGIFQEFRSVIELHGPTGLRPVPAMSSSKQNGKKSEQWLSSRQL